MNAKWLPVWICMLGFVGGARGELKSDELLVIYNANSPDSRQLTEYYAQKRRVPRANLLGLDLPLQEDISRLDYDRKMVAPIRQYMWDKKLSDQIRCLVTVYDVPLRVGEVELTPPQKERLAWIDGQIEELRTEIEQAINSVHALAEGARGERADQISRIGRRHMGVSEMRKAYVYYRRVLSDRLIRLGDDPEAARARMAFLGIALKMDGLQGAAHQVSIDPGIPDEHVLANLAELREKYLDTEDDIKPLLAKGVMSPDYPKAIGLAKLHRGLTNVLRQLERNDRPRLVFDLSDAAVDSELALLWWRPYRLKGFLFNWLHYTARERTKNEAGEVREVYSETMLMTARLDGPSPKVVRRMIDDAIDVERGGLKGTLYIDRDPSRRAKRGYKWMDDALGATAEAVRKTTGMHVVTDESAMLFAPGACPQTALYCGWYSLMQYVDAFGFVPGAVGYHIASGEAVSLRDPTKPYWCKEMLARGAAATLGAVKEPYLQALPRPQEFFGFLLTGRYTLAEVFTLVNPFVSWRVILIGDPLYNAFGADPQLRLEDVLPPQVRSLQLGKEHYGPVPKGPRDFQRKPKSSRPTSRPAV